MPVVPMRPVQVDRLRRWSTVLVPSASYDSRDCKSEVAVSIYGSRREMASGWGG